MEKLRNDEVTLLVPTMNKNSEKEIIDLCERMNINSNAIIANQCGKESKSTLMFRGHTILVFCSKEVGVSKNRNLLLKNAFGRYGIFMDDDGIMSNDYSDIVAKEFAATQCSWIKFNVKIIESAKRETNTLCTKRGVASYGMVSQYGMPGFAFTIEKKNKNYSFSEEVGIPNYVFHGEDSLFIHYLFKKEKIFCSDEIIASIIQGESSWFSNYNDQYYITQGYLYKKMHSIFAPLYVARMYYKKRKLFNKSFLYIYKRAKIGFKMVGINSAIHADFAQSKLKKI